MTLALGEGVEVEIDPPPIPSFTLAPPAGPTVSIDPGAVPSFTMAPPAALDVAVVPVAGPPGPAGGEPFVYAMPVAQTTALVAHNLGRDPVAVQVLLNGQQVDEFSVSFPSPGSTVLVGFDIAAQATIRLL